MISLFATQHIPFLCSKFFRELVLLKWRPEDASAADKALYDANFEKVKDLFGTQTFQVHNNAQASSKVSVTLTPVKLLMIYWSKLKVHMQ